MAADKDQLTTIDLQSDDTDNSGLQVDAAALAVAAFFGAAPPLNIGFAKAAAIEADASLASQLDGAENFMLSTGNDIRFGNTTRTEREKQATDDSIAFMATLFGETDRKRAREIEHERQWMAQSHSYAGQTLDGTQWKAMIDWFRSDANVAEWEDAMMAETGQSREEVRRTGGKMKSFYDLMDKDAKGTLTTHERAEFKRLNDDRDVKRGVEVQQEIQELRHSQSADLTNQNDSAWDDQQAASAKSFAATLDDDIGVQAAVQPLTSAYKNAAAGTAPVAPAVPTTSPPAQTIQLNPDNMFG